MKATSAFDVGTNTALQHEVHLELRQKRTFIEHATSVLLRLYGVHYTYIVEVECVSHPVKALTNADLCFFLNI